MQIGVSSFGSPNSKRLHRYSLLPSQMFSGEKIRTQSRVRTHRRVSLMAQVPSESPATIRQPRCRLPDGSDAQRGRWTDRPGARLRKSSIWLTTSIAGRASFPLMRFIAPWPENADSPRTSRGAETRRLECYTAVPLPERYSRRLPAAPGLRLRSEKDVLAWVTDCAWGLRRKGARSAPFGVIVA
jgi:hypothetical protein